MPGAHVVGDVLVVDTDLTVEQVLELYPDSRHIELIGGKLVVSPVPAFLHGGVLKQLTRSLDESVKVAMWFDHVPRCWIVDPVAASVNDHESAVVPPPTDGPGLPAVPSSVIVGRPRT